MTTTLDVAAVRKDIAELLFMAPEELGDDEDLIAAGLDSVRILGLVERWRAAGLEVSFAELAERAMLRGWLALLEPRLAVGGRAAGVNGG
jgi:aryl carrier-like protein